MIEKLAWQFVSKHESDEGLNTSILHWSTTEVEPTKH